MSSVAPSLRLRVKRLESTSAGGPNDRAAQMRACRERRLALSPADQEASHRRWIEAGLAALATPDCRPGTRAAAVQDMQRRRGSRHLTNRLTTLESLPGDTL